MSDEKKPVPMGPGDKGTPIRLGGTNLASMLGSVAVPKPNAAGTIQAAQSVHDAYLDRMGILTGGRADAARASVQARAQAPSKSHQVTTLFAAGKTVYDTERGRKAVIVAANVARTKKGTPVHELVDRQGNAWRQKETKLR